MFTIEPRVPHTYTILTRDNFHYTCIITIELRIVKIISTR